jgi:anti-sigma B factor antagonist
MVSDLTPPLEVAVDRAGPALTVSVRGELDLAGADSARARLLAAVDEGVARVEVDLGELTFLDSSGLAVFLELAALAEVTIVRASPAVRRIVETTGLQDVLGLQP